MKEPRERDAWASELDVDGRRALVCQEAHLEEAHGTSFKGILGHIRVLLGHVLRG